MIKHSSNQTVFEQRMLALKFIARRAPRRTSCADLAEIVNGSTRTHHRILEELVKLGYLECDKNNPKGFWFNKESFKEFL